MKKNNITKVEDIAIGKTFTKEGVVYTVVGRDDVFTFASRGDGVRYLFINGVKLNHYGK